MNNQYRTRKRELAIQTLYSHGLDLRTALNKTIYREMKQRGYIWNPRSQKWEIAQVNGNAE